MALRLDLSKRYVQHNSSRSHEVLKDHDLTLPTPESSEPPHQKVEISKNRRKKKKLQYKDPPLATPFSCFLHVVFHLTRCHGPPPSHTAWATQHSSVGPRRTHFVPRPRWSRVRGSKRVRREGWSPVRKPLAGSGEDPQPRGVGGDSLAQIPIQL